MFLRTQAGRNREIRTPHVGTRRDERRKQKEARVRGFEVGFEGAVHLSDLR